MASFTHETLQVPLESHAVSRGRPPFRSHKTLNRLNDCENRTASNKRPQPRTSIFKEIGLDDLSPSHHPSIEPHLIENPGTTKIQFDDRAKGKSTADGVDETHKAEKGQWFSKLGTRRPTLTTASSAPTTYSKMSKVTLIVLLVAAVVPRYSGESRINIVGADAGVIREAELVDNGSTIEGRKTTPTAICTRWSHMSMSCKFEWEEEN